MVRVGIWLALEGRDQTAGGFIIAALAHNTLEIAIEEME